MQAVILAHRRDADGPLALRRVCGVPLVRRQLQVLRTCEWRQVLTIVHPHDRQAIEAAMGAPEDLGVQLSYLTWPHNVDLQSGDLSAEACLEATAGDLLIVEGHYVIEGALLERLVAAGTTAVLCEEPSRVGDPPLGEETPSPEGAYAGAAFLTRSDFRRLASEAQAPPFVHSAGAPGWFPNGLRTLPWPAGLGRLPSVRRVNVRREDLYVAEVRRPVEPFWCEVRSNADARACKHRLVIGAQKRTLDVVAWYMNRPLENWLTLRLTDWPITPNQMSAITSLVAFVVTGLYLLGLMLPAALLALVVNVLDGVDGKLARAKALTTRVGQLEHSFDLLYEQSWYIAYTWATYRLWPSLAVLAVGFIMLLCDSFARHVSMQYRQVMGISLADYAPFDRRFRHFDGRRNIYSIYMLLGVVVGRPFYALVAMALHAAITGLVYVIRAGLHLRRADRGIVGRRP
jgi:phosphatidylglycerophosphate synthase